jgi:hypothetical protein
MKNQEKQESTKQSKKSIRTIILCAVLLILVLLVVSLRNIVGQYYYAFILRSSETVSVAMANMDPLSYTTAEQDTLAPLESQWDSYRNSRLCDQVTTQAADGTTLAGRLYNNDSEVTVVVLHRYDGSSQEDFLYSDCFGDYNLLLPDARNHGESGGEACSFGALEQYDLVSWLDWVKDNLGEQRVILYGEDMGASTALMASENGLLPENVAFIVADSPYTSLKEIADYAMSKWYKIPKIMTHFMGTMSDQADNGFQVAEADALSHAQQGKTPALFLLGENNKYIPAEQTQALYDSWGGEKELFSCDSRNGLIYAEHSEEIRAILNQWMERYL